MLGKVQLKIGRIAEPKPADFEKAIDLVLKEFDVGRLNNMLAVASRMVLNEQQMKKGLFGSMRTIG